MNHHKTKCLYAIIFWSLFLIPKSSKHNIKWDFQVFGGRDWTAAGNVAGASPPENGSLRRGQSTKIRKKKSITNITLLKVLY